MSPEKAAESYTPAEIVGWLDRHVVGQDRAKRTVSIALRNRYRRRLVEEPMRSEIYPSNLIMMGPTGIGKTEIARRLASLVGAPFVKVEATKYTETGYVGRDVESMVRHLVRQAVNLAGTRARRSKADLAARATENRLLEALGRLPEYESAARDRLSRLYRSGELDGVSVEIMVAQEAPGVEVFPMMPGTGMDGALGESLRNMMKKVMGGRRKKASMTVGDARERVYEEEMTRLLEGGDHTDRGLAMAAEEGIIFIDEIDKIIGTEGGSGPDVSRMGVQRDLLPLVEGCTVQTRYGPVRTDHILFVAAGAFHGASPSDLIPELQGRFPLRVSLDPLSEEDLLKILTEPEGSLLKQFRQLLAADGVQLELTPGAAAEVASVAWRMNEAGEDIGARRLRPVMSHLLDDCLFGAPDLVRGKVKFHRRKAAAVLAGLVGNEDEGDYIL
ncbi:MAG: ATP-dependent protease ATPase subunit HslU [Candidatus Fermentibacteraceae bacterium]